MKTNMIQEINEIQVSSYRSLINGWCDFLKHLTFVSSDLFVSCFSFFVFCFLFLVSCSFSGCAGLQTYNPATGRGEFIFISTEREVAMGQDVHAQLRKEYKFSEDLSKLRRLRDIGYRVAKASDRQDYVYYFYLIEDDSLNAFTTPGGHIYFFTGLFDKLAADDEIASVLAHEIGHCAAKHVVKKYQAAFGYNLLGAVIGSQAGEGAGDLAVKSANTAMGLIFSAYSRQDELQADTLGLKYMHQSGYDLNGMIKTFEILLANSQGGNVPSLFRTHPHVEDRIEKVKEEIELYKKAGS
jgi:predicted Zn-dependent protease